jgi:hypothetical protein
MDLRRIARRELVLLAVVLVVLARAIDGPAAGLVAVLILLTVAAGTLGALAHDEPRGVPIEALAIPAVLASGAAGAIHLIPANLLLVPAIGALAYALTWVLRLEGRLAASPSGPTDSDRARVIWGASLAAFVAFAGVAAIVPGGLPEPQPPSGAPGDVGAIPEGALLALAGADAVAAFLLGYRLSSLRFGSVRDAAWSATTYAIVIAITAGAARAIDLPRLAAPAVLALVLYLWDRLHGTAPTRRREARFIWETALLAVVGVVVVAWNLGLRA